MKHQQLHTRTYSRLTDGGDVYRPLTSIKDKDMIFIKEKVSWELPAEAGNHSNREDFLWQTADGTGLSVSPISSQELGLQADTIALNPLPSVASSSPNGTDGHELSKF
ncbi:hypothetical protein AXG93_2091s1190 [Marchantia polymorpha subsp. ruderalis]|uniref:Uncharacterized protein n=1 Tax=Marchantia polymorpha subsp. ruderalis TaxID=1480154 RepID=A0A176W8C2_MARPO|nr:hypothetical protein AXG93_2091s1190 [Marchantia polymorpha subsp. ruderalis]